MIAKMPIASPDNDRDDAAAAGETLSIGKPHDRRLRVHGIVLCCILRMAMIYDHGPDSQKMRDAIHPAPAPIVPQNGPTTNIIANEPSAPIPHAASFGPSEAM